MANNLPNSGVYSSEKFFDANQIEKIKREYDREIALEIDALEQTIKSRKNIRFWILSVSAMTLALCIICPLVFSHTLLGEANSASAYAFRQNVKMFSAFCALPAIALIILFSPLTTTPLLGYRTYVDQVSKLRQCVFSPERAIVDSVKEQFPRHIPGNSAVQSALLNNGKSLIYNSQVLIFLDPAQISKLVLLRIGDCREAKISTRLKSQKSSSSSIIESKTSPALAGAAIGAIFLGEEAMTTGAIVGSSGARRVDEQGTIVSNYSTIVSVYTILEKLPSISFDFGNSEDDANHFYGLVSSQIDRTKRT